MSTSKSTTESSSSARTGSVPSSYFQTEFPICCDGTSDIESSTISGTIVDESVDVSEKISMQISGVENSLKKKVSISIQADRSIIGKEDSLPKERKRWIRPPVLGQASNNETNAVSICETTNSSDSDQEHQSKLSVNSKQGDFVKEQDNYKNRKDNISDKTLEGSSDQSLPTGGDLGDFQRIPTPSSVSSVTSRPLEWDSGADVGYFQEYDAAQRTEIELSSIERIALDQGRTGALKRSDPEGKSSTKKKLQGNSAVVNIIGVPTSESTPLSNCNVQYNSRKQNFTLDEKGHNSYKHQHLFPEVIIQNKGNESDSSCDLNKSRKLKINEEQQLNTLKKSSSFENLNDSKLPDRQNSTFPRSHSHLNLADNTIYIHNPQIENIINPPQSVSSSSIATVVTGTPHKNSKCIQTSYNKNNAATQSSLLGPANRADKTREKKPSENNSSTLESTQMSAGDRVNSFEYLPGHMYENAQKSDDKSLWKDGGVSLKDDVERGVHLLEEFIQGSNANNTLMKKELIQRVVKRLIQSDYPEDDDSQNSIPLRCSTRRSQNRDEAIGESSSENIPPLDKKMTGNSTSLSGHSSSVWLSVTESSKSSEPSDPKLVNKKSAPIKKKDINEGEKRPQSTTDYSTDTKLDWKAPITKAEKLYENKRKGGKIENEKLFDFLNAERENQLDWIVQEIDHLSNLKSLLEKHEKLRRNLQRLKKERQMKNGKPEDIRPTNHPKQYGFRRKPLLGSDIPSRPPPAPVYSKEKKVSTEETWDSHNYDTSDRLKLKKSVSTETRKEDIFGLRRATAYTITFDNDQPKKKEKEHPAKPLIADRQTLAKETREHVRETYHLPTLQDYLLVKRPDIVSRAEIRRKTVAELSAVRQLRQEKRPEVLAAALSSGNSLMPPPPPPLVKRVVSQKEMREQTERKYRQTFEVKKKILERKSRETLKTNRLMADMYNKRLQLLTLKGHTHLSNSIDVISTV